MFRVHVNNLITKCQILWNHRYVYYIRVVLYEIWKYIKYPSILVILASIYYSYLNKLYLVDEVSDVNMLRELQMIEKTTLILIPPKTEKGLKKFIEKYSLCQAVYEIIILIQLDTKAPIVDDYFTFTKTHSKVTFYSVDQTIPGFQYLIDRNNVKTQSMMYLNPNVKITCDDIYFTQNVYRSSNQSLVGYFPRLYTYQYQSKLSVWLERKYNLILPVAVMMSAEYIWTSPSITDPNLIQKREDMVNYIRKHPYCQHIAINLYPLFIHQARPPVYVDIPIQYDSRIELTPIHPTRKEMYTCSEPLTTTKGSLLTRTSTYQLCTERYNTCIHDLITILHHHQFSLYYHHYSHHKVIKARKSLVW